MRFVIREVGKTKNIKIFKLHYEAKDYLYKNKDKNLVGIVQTNNRINNKDNWIDIQNSEFYYNSKEVK